MKNSERFTSPDFNIVKKMRKNRNPIWKMKLSRTGLDLSGKRISPPPDEVVIVFKRPLFNWAKSVFFPCEKAGWGESVGES